MSAEKSGSACAEVRRVLLEGEGDPAAGSRVAAHLGRCADCRQTRDRLLALRADVARAADPLDDMRRARVLGRLAAALDDQAADGGARRRTRIALRPRTRWLLAPVIGSLALAALWLWVSADRSAPSPSSSPAPAVATRSPVAAPVRPAAGKLAVLQPYRRSPAPGSTAPLPAHPVDRLEVPAGSKLRLHLGSRATATLIGPARMQVVSNEGASLEVNLAQGTLVANYDHRAGGQLLVHSPAAVTRVVGTLFSVNAGASGSRIVVARGRVVVTGPRGPVRTLAAGDALTTDTAALTTPTAVPQRWTREDRHPLEDHARAAPDDAAAPAAIVPDDAATPPPVPLPVRSAQARRQATAAVSSAQATAPVPPAESTAPVAVEAPIMAPVAPAPVPQPAPIVQAPPVPPAAALPPPPRVPPAAAPAPATAESLYQRAEQAMRRRDWTTARHQLNDVVALATGHPLEDVARYELAQLALRAGDAPHAIALLDDLLRSDREPALRQPAWLLRCELHLQAGERPQGRRCLERFRAAYPYSPQDEAALGLLMGTFAPDPACAGVSELADEYLQRYPAGSRAEEARRHRDRCRR